jgi:hypothetical protein
MAGGREVVPRILAVEGIHRDWALRIQPDGYLLFHGTKVAVSDLRPYNNSGVELVS